MSAEADEYAPLARLHPALTALRLTDPQHLPSCMGRLTGLRRLSEWLPSFVVFLCC